MSACPHGAALALLVALAGCDVYRGEKKGEGGLLGFYEPNDYAADQASSAVGFERPIALGARADAWVLAPGISSLAGATVDDPAIVGVSLDIYPIVLRGLAEGTTTLRVSTSSASDALALTVVRPDGARLWAPNAGRTSFAVPDSFFGTGPALRAGASVSVAGEPLAGRQPLLGFDIFRWSVDPPLLSHAPDGPVVNRQRFTALGMGGVAAVSTQFGGSFQIVTLSNSEVPTLKIYRAPLPPSPPIAITALEPQDLDGFLLGASDAAGHYVVPAPQDDAQFAVDVATGSVVLLEAKLRGRNVSLRACSGNGTLRIRYLGAELLVPVQVTSDAADPACP
jgi:hypothetical protein